MGAELVRISGPLLANNLYRYGTDLAFETSLLYLTVNAKQIGVKTTATVSDLTVNGTTNTTILQVPQFTNISSGFSISTNYIQNLAGSITLQPNQASNPTINVVGLLGTEGITTANLLANNNNISATTANTNVVLSPTGRLIVGTPSANTDTLINGSLHATGNITWDGNITLGNAPNDTVSFGAEINSNIYPSATNTYSLGSSSQRWSNLYTYTYNPTVFTSASLTAPTLNAGNIQVRGNNITNTVGGQSINLEPNGTVYFNSVQWISSNQIINNTNDALSLSSTGNGYYKFGGTFGTVIPFGDTGSRPASPENGTLRYNTDTRLSEVYESAINDWVPAQGAAPALSTDQINDVINDWALILGL